MEPPVFLRKTEKVALFCQKVALFILPFYREISTILLVVIKEQCVRKGGTSVLDAVTKKYIDASTEEQFSFSFFCDCCSKVVSTTKLAFRPGFEKKLFLSRTEQKARELVWQRDHDSAYERANVEALKKLNRCVICGEAICNDCTVEC